MLAQGFTKHLCSSARTWWRLTDMSYISHMIKSIYLAKSHVLSAACSGVPEAKDH